MLKKTTIILRIGENKKKKIIVTVDDTHNGLHLRHYVCCDGLSKKGDGDLHVLLIDILVRLFSLIRLVHAPLLQPFWAFESHIGGEAGYIVYTTTKFCLQIYEQDREIQTKRISSNTNISIVKEKLNTTFRITADKISGPSKIT